MQNVCEVLCLYILKVCQAPLSMELSRQKYWSGLPFPSPKDLPDSGIEPGSPTFEVDSLLSEPQGKPIYVYTYAQRNLLQELKLRDYGD